MLRRDFVKLSALTFGGIILAGNFVFAGPEKKHEIKKPSAKILNLQGNAGAGCATSPDVCLAMEHGLNATPI